MFRQFKLQDSDDVIITWLPDDKRLKPGNFVTLKDFHEPGKLWRILWRSKHAVEGRLIFQARDWDNNI